MARLIAMDRMSVKSLPGLTQEDVRELQALGLGSIQSVMDAMDANRGDLTQVSTNAIVIEDEQSHRIGNAVVKVAPEAFRDRYEIVEVQVARPAQQTAVTQVSPARPRPAQQTTVTQVSPARPRPAQQTTVTQVSPARPQVQKGWLKRILETKI